MAFKIAKPKMVEIEGAIAVNIADCVATQTTGDAIWRLLALQFIRGLILKSDFDWLV